MPAVPETIAFDLIAQDIKSLKNLSDEEFLAKFQAYLDMFRSTLKPEQLLRYRDQIKDMEWAQ